MPEPEWVELRVAHDEIEAEIIRTLLESENIPVMVVSSMSRTIYPSLSCIKIYVPHDSAEIASQILERAGQESESPEA